MYTGIVIPQKTGLAEGEKRRPVRYGSRVRPKKPSVQPDDKSATPTEDNLSQVDGMLCNNHVTLMYLCRGSC